MTVEYSLFYAARRKLHQEVIEFGMFWGGRGRVFILNRI